jgi:MSHA biogenesis protein MshQ
VPKVAKGFSLTADKTNINSILARLKALLCLQLTTNHTRYFLLGMALLISCNHSANATVIEFNNTGGTSSTNGLHFYIEDTTHIQVKRLNNTGQVYSPSVVPASSSLDNGVFLRANGKVYGPSHNVTTFTPTGGMYNSYSISTPVPINPPSNGDQQISTGNFGITSGPQVNIIWKYTTPLDFLTAEVTLVIPASYAVSAINPVRYYHAFDTYLGGSDNGCGLRYTDSNGKLVIGTYPPTGSTCPSTTTIPSGVSVVESFRERSGLTFSNYCASGWSEFWTGSNCSVLQTANMNNTVSATYQDTGIGIQYTFIAPGTYTFSYDFVVGSPNVPPYDHLEIRHPGSANLCPVDLTVLACTSATVPCPAANIVNTGTLTGSIKTTPTIPTITQTPTVFTLGSSAPTATVSLQGSGAGAYTLSTTGLSTTPLNGTKCWDTSSNTASCAYVVNNTPCVKGFECIETGVAYNNLTSSPSARNPLYTKLTATGFKFDVVALQDLGVTATSYTASSGVTVELFDDSSSPQPACSAYSSPVASQAITFAAVDSGRKTVPANFTVTNAYKKLRCRVKDTNVSVYGCSSDDFSVRPQSFSLSQAGLGSSPISAGTNFSLTAASGVTGYNGTPKLLPTNTKAANTAAGAQSSIGTGMLTLADVSNTIVTDTTNNVFPAASGSPSSAALSLRYHDVGYLNFNAGAVIDDSYTGIDQTADCITGSGSNTLTSGKYGCEVWSSALSDIGRFKPDHFRLTSTMTSACNAGTTATTADDFTYMSDPHLSISAVAKAESSQNITASRYGNSCPTAGSCKLTLTTQNNAVQIDASRLQPVASLPSGTSLVGTGATSSYQSTSWVNGTYTVSGSTYQYNRGATADGPYDNFNINFAVTDPDGVIFSGASKTADSRVRYGKLFIPNVYGSELLPLPVLVEAKYWNGTSYVRNQLDSCTILPASSISMSNYRNNLSACETQLGYSAGSGALVNGVFRNLRLTKPGSGNNGTVDLTLNLGSVSAAPKDKTCTGATETSAIASGLSWFGTNTTSRATFGIYKTPIIYLRENFNIP